MVVCVPLCPMNHCMPITEKLVTRIGTNSRWTEHIIKQLNKNVHRVQLSGARRWKKAKVIEASKRDKQVPEMRHSIRRSAIIERSLSALLIRQYKLVLFCKKHAWISGLQFSGVTDGSVFLSRSQSIKGAKSFLPVEHLKVFFETFSLKVSSVMCFVEPGVSERPPVSLKGEHLRMELFEGVALSVRIFFEFSGKNSNCAKKSSLHFVNISSLLSVFSSAVNG